MEDKQIQRRKHSIAIDNRNIVVMTGITDVISFDLNRVLLESDYGVITVKGSNLHVSRLTVEKGELDIDGEIDSIEYSQSKAMKKGESFLARLIK